MTLLSRLWRDHAHLTRHRDFRWLFLSQALSTTGDHLAGVALAILVIQQTGSATDLAIVIAAKTAALVVALPLGGVWADRLPRHLVMLRSDLLRGSLHAVLALLLVFDIISLWEIVAAEVAFGAADGFFRPAYRALVPQTVPELCIQDANAAVGLTDTLAEFIGPAIGAALVLTAGTAAAFAVDAITFVGSAALLGLIRPRPRGEIVRAAPTSVLTELREGYREVRSRPWVWVTIAVFSIHLVVGFGTYLVLGPSVAASRYGDPALWGSVAASLGLGTTLGTFIGMLWMPARPLVGGILAAVPFGGLLLVYAIGFPLPMVFVVGTIAGIGVALFTTWWNTALAHWIPPHALSRVASFDFMGSYALLPIGYLAVGALAGHFNAAAVMAINGAIAVALLAIALLPAQTRALGQPDYLRGDRPATANAVPDAA